MTSQNGPAVTPLIPSPGAAPAPPAAKPAAPHRDGIREVVETIVFVTVLVLLLKSFVAEAFVIPTGSMAETLLGYQRFVTCSDCGHVYPVNCSEEVEPQDNRTPTPVEASTCPNCRFHEVFRRLGPHGHVSPPGSGDRVLVAKGPFQGFERWDVVVFKYPEGPQKQYVPMNYIKRLIGLSRETIAIYNGDLYAFDDRHGEQIDYSGFPEYVGEGGLTVPATDLWQRRFSYPNAEAAIKAFYANKFNILRKRPQQVLAMRRIVFDNDHQPAALAGKVRPRWRGDGWQGNDAERPVQFTGIASGETAWLRYEHLVVSHGTGQPLPSDPQPEFIKNFTGYNMFEPAPLHSSRDDENAFWVGDLILECEVESKSDAGEFVMELSKGADRYQARFDLASGGCRLVRIHPDAQGKLTETELAKQATRLKGRGTHRVRFANVDQRLTVWVDESLPFADGETYTVDPPRPSDSPEPHPLNDKQPASVGVRGGEVVVRHVRLDRDTYYTGSVGGASDPKVATRYVQPGHYLCLGDNSTQSSDSRYWGLVPERLMLGQARMVYYPFWPLGQNRAGPIR